MASHGATQETLSAILKEFYLGPIQEQLNNEMLILQTMEKTTVDWNGRVAIIPVHIDRNIGVNFAAEGGELPAAGNQRYDRLQINARFLYGRFQITGPAMSAAGKGGANSFIGWMDSEMKKLVTDVKNLADANMISGGRCVGYINQHNAGGAGTTYTMFGDVEKLEAMRDTVVALAGAPELRVDLIRMDTYAQLPNGAAGTFISVASTDLVNRTFTSGGGLAGTVDTTGVADGVAIAVVVSVTQDIAAAITAVAVLDEQPIGVFGNLSTQAHFGVDRTDLGGAATGANSLQSTCITNNVLAAGTSTPINLSRLQGTLDQVLLLSGKEPNVIFMNPVQRQMYSALFQLTTAGTSGVMNVSGEKSTELNGGFSGLSYGSLPIKTSRHVANGGLIFMRTDTWKLLELQGHEFADIDGDVLIRVANHDSYEGYYRWYYNTVCTNPNQNAILAGLTLS